MEWTTYVRRREAGYHRWSDAPFHRAYLRDRHRHTFHFEVALLVSDPDRQVEFHDLLDDVFFALARWRENGALEFGSMSCEMIAQALAIELCDKHATTCYVDVSEDGENGGRAIQNPTEVPDA